MCMFCSPHKGDFDNWKEVLKIWELSTSCSSVFNKQRISLKGAFLLKYSYSPQQTELLLNKLLNTFKKLKEENQFITERVNRPFPFFYSSFHSPHPSPPPKLFSMFTLITNFARHFSFFYYGVKLKHYNAVVFTYQNVQVVNVQLLVRISEHYSSASALQHIRTSLMCIFL